MHYNNYLVIPIPYLVAQNKALRIKFNITISLIVKSNLSGELVRLQVQLNRGIDNQLTDGVIVELAQNHIDDFENLWREQLRVFQTEDKFWDWLFKLGYISNNENEEGYALEVEGYTQGLMMVETQLHGSREAIGQRLVYIQYITSAPWNRKEIQRPPRYRGVGAALL